jgi:ABC-type antimicrobial peptide transport system permease subunit
LRLALGASRTRILRQLLTEAVLISLVGGAVGLLGSIALLQQMSMWQPFPGAPIHLPVNPDATIYGVALALAFGSAPGLLLGILASRVLTSIVYQATPRDPLVLAGVVLIMALLGLLATWIPAQRALSIDPMILLREE